LPLRFLEQALRPNRFRAYRVALRSPLLPLPREAEQDVERVEFRLAIAAVDTPRVAVEVGAPMQARWPLDRREDPLVLR
jgi:hypothetical protein